MLVSRLLMRRACVGSPLSEDWGRGERRLDLLGIDCQICCLDFSSSCVSTFRNILVPIGDESTVARVPETSRLTVERSKSSRRKSWALICVQTDTSGSLSSAVCEDDMSCHRSLSSDRVLGRVGFRDYSQAESNDSHRTIFEENHNYLVREWGVRSVETFP